MQTGDNAPKKEDVKEVYNLVADTVGGVPSLRWKDNLIQGVSILGSAIVGTLVGYALTFDLFCAVPGTLVGLIGGLMISGGPWRDAGGLRR